MVKRALLVAAVFAGVYTSALAGTASASGAPTAGSGAFTVPSRTVVSFAQKGGVTFLVLNNVVDWTGTITGEAQETLYITVRPSGDFVFHGTDTFSDGRTMSLTGSGDSTAAFQGAFTLTGTGSNGYGTFEGAAGCGGSNVCGTYAGNFGT